MYVLCCYCVEIPFSDCIELHNVVRNDSGADHHNSTHESAAQEYFSRNMLRISPSIEDVGHVRPELAGCLFAAWAIVYVALLKGVKSVGKVRSEIIFQHANVGECSRSCVRLF